MNGLTPEQLARLQALVAAVNTAYLLKAFGGLAPAPTLTIFGLPVYVQTDDPQATVTVTQFAVVGGLPR